jgi:hypothetical protein
LVASILVLLLYAHIRGALSLPEPISELVRAMVFVEMLALLWQCFFFVRTDFYYVIATVSGCKNLLGDTEVWLRNRLARWLPGLNPVDQSALPEHELRTIRAYAAVWLVGRTAALALFFLVTIPVVLGYVESVGATLVRGVQGHPYPFIDALVAALLVLLPLTAGLALWIRSLAGGRKEIR